MRLVFAADNGILYHTPHSAQVFFCFFLLGWFGPAPQAMHFPALPFGTASPQPPHLRGGLPLRPGSRPAARAFAATLAAMASRFRAACSGVRGLRGVGWLLICRTVPGSVARARVFSLCRSSASQPLGSTGRYPATAGNDRPRRRRWTCGRVHTSCTGLFRRRSFGCPPVPCLNRARPPPQNAPFVTWRRFGMYGTPHALTFDDVGDGVEADGAAFHRGFSPAERAWQRLDFHPSSFPSSLQTNICFFPPGGVATSTMRRKIAGPMSGPNRLRSHSPPPFAVQNVSL